MARTEILQQERKGWERLLPKPAVAAYWLHGAVRLLRLVEAAVRSRDTTPEVLARLTTRTDASSLSGVRLANPYFGARAGESAEELGLRLGVVQTAVALELWHATHGSYPERLAEMGAADAAGCEYTPRSGKQGYQLSEVGVGPSLRKDIALILQRQ